MKTLLLILVSFVAVTAIPSGLLLVISPGGDIIHLPLSLLNSTPFKSFLLPGIILTFIVGGVNLLAAISLIRGSVNRYNGALAGGIIISGWIVVQVILINAVHWLHFLYFGIGIIIILLAYQLKGKWAA